MRGAYRPYELIVSTKIGIAALALVMLTGCGASGGEGGNATSGWWVSVGDTWGIAWGEGESGAVLVHGAAYDAASWEAQGRALEENGIVTLAVEDTRARNVRSAIEYLKEEYGVESVAVIGASAGAGSVLQVAREDPGEVSQIILLSGTGDVSGLGEHPKLFVASEEESIADQARLMAGEAPGDRNEALILQGDAHAQAIFRTDEGERLTRAILNRLEEYG